MIANIPLGRTRELEDHMVENGLRMTVLEMRPDKGSARVEFESQEKAEMALKILQGAVMDGRSLRAWLSKDPDHVIGYLPALG